MSVWGKLITAFKGHANRAGEAVQDANLMTILEQEVREARKAIAAAKDEKARMSANRKLKEKSIAEVMGEVERRTEAARTAKEQGDEPLAIEIIKSVLKLRDKVEADQQLFDQYKATEERMDSTIRQSENKIETLQRKMESAKANEALIKAQKAASTNTTASDGKLASAVDSLARLEQRQAEQQAMLEAADEEARLESGADLEAKIRALESPERNDVAALLAKL
ncbi:PspA/IM30 family protein [Roseibium sp. HPY-6]|uniref:PspA/IM30 family protein n=1 Tax=Roseibium sp. HPY-6 TaxID=3229852 RepID=UPI00338DA010